MWDYIKMWNIWGRVGIIIGFLGFLAGMASTFQDDPLAGIILSTAFISVFYLVFKFTLGPEVESRRILEQGEPAEATILEVKETGWTINNIYYVVKFVLEVRPKNLPSYKTEAQGMISRLTMSQFQVGAVVPVKYDSREPKKVALVQTKT